MKKLIALLEKSGVGFIKGNYKSFDEFSHIEIKTIMNVVFSINNEKIGEYPLLVVSKGVAGNRRVKGIICDEKGKPFCPLKDYEDHIHATLIAFEGEPDDLGTFIIHGPFCEVNEFKPE